MKNLSVSELPTKKIRELVEHSSLVGFIPIDSEVFGTKKFDAAKIALKTEVNSEIAALNSRINANTSSLTVLNARVSEVEAKIPAGALVFKGANTAAEISSFDLSEVEVGYVYSVSDGGTISYEYPAGTAKTLVTQEYDEIAWSSNGWYIVGREKEVDLTDYPRSSELGAAAFSNSYNDLSNKPTIGTGTLTLQINGNTVDTFGANANDNKTIDLPVPDASSLAGDGLTASGEELNVTTPVPDPSDNDGKFLTVQHNSNNNTDEVVWGNLPTPSAEGFAGEGLEYRSDNNTLNVKVDETTIKNDINSGLYVNVDFDTIVFDSNYDGLCVATPVPHVDDGDEGKVLTVVEGVPSWEDLGFSSMPRESVPIGRIDQNNHQEIVITNNKYNVANGYLDSRCSCLEIYLGGEEHPDTIVVCDTSTATSALDSIIVTNGDTELKRMYPAHTFLDSSAIETASESAKTVEEHFQDNDTIFIRIIGDFFTVMTGKSTLRVSSNQ
jgi:hypothetical protein